MPQCLHQVTQLILTLLTHTAIANWLIHSLTLSIQTQQYIHEHRVWQSLSYRSCDVLTLSMGVFWSSMLCKCSLNFIRCWRSERSFVFESTCSSRLLTTSSTSRYCACADNRCVRVRACEQHTIGTKTSVKNHLRYYRALRRLRMRAHVLTEFVEIFKS